MIKGCQGNTVYTFLDFGLASVSYKSILDGLYENGLMAIVTVDADGTFDTANLRSVVNAYKNHPAILMWAIGNEWNINLYHNHFTTVQQAAQGTEAAAQIIRAIDTIHPIASIYGDISITGQVPNTITIVNTLCPTVDVWGLNIYRGMEFFDLFTSWAAITSKPMFLSEFGIDSFHTTQWDPLPPVGYVAEQEQSTWDHSLWLDILPELSAKDPQKQCLGGTYFEFNDEYWKVLPTGIQNTGGFFPSWNPTSFPDSFFNEEYFGAVAIDSNIRMPKLCFAQMAKDFHDTLVADYIACITNSCVNAHTEFNFIDLSSGSPTTWLWNFGDGVTSNLPNPKHTYLAAGAYTVTLSVFDSIYTSSLQKTEYINIDPATIPGVISGGTTISLGALTDTLRLSGNAGSILTWQKQLNGGGYNDIPATTGLTWYIETPNVSGTWDYRTIIKNGICNTELSTSTSVVVVSGPVVRTWAGGIDEKWNKAGNWSPTGVPTTQDDVIIPVSAPVMPVLKVQGFGCNNLLIKAGATMNINPGFILSVNGQITIEGE